jgi:hypothetical protein
VSDFDPQARERRLLRERVAAEQQEAEAWRPCGDAGDG